MAMSWQNHLNSKDRSGNPFFRYLFCLSLREMKDGDHSFFGVQPTSFVTKRWGCKTCPHRHSGDNFCQHGGKHGNGICSDRVREFVYQWALMRSPGGYVFKLQESAMNREELLLELKGRYEALRNGDALGKDEQALIDRYLRVCEKYDEGMAQLESLRLRNKEVNAIGNLPSPHMIQRIIRGDRGEEVGDGGDKIDELFEGNAWEEKIEQSKYRPDDMPKIEPRTKKKVDDDVKE